MFGSTSKLASPTSSLSGMVAARALPSSATSPCISPSTSSQGACARSSSSAWRIFTALGWLLLPKLECDSSAGLGRMPKRIISPAASPGISPSGPARGARVPGAGVVVHMRVRQEHLPLGQQQAVHAGKVVHAGALAYHWLDVVQVVRGMAPG